MNTENSKQALFAQEIYTDILKAGLIPCFETSEGVTYIEPFENGFNVGGVCNVGLLVDFHFEVDCDFSADENLQALCEEIQEREVVEA